MKHKHVSVGGGEVSLRPEVGLYFVCSNNLHLISMVTELKMLLVQDDGKNPNVRIKV